MRVTNRMLNSTLLNNLNRNLNMMKKTQEQMSSGKSVSRPSDNPIAVTQIMGMKSVLLEQEQHMKNMQDGIGWLEATDKALGNATEVIKRAQELAVKGANGTMPQDSREALAKEIGQLQDELKQIANTNYAGRYIFGGTYTNKVPFAGTADAIVYSGNDADMRWEIGPGVTMAVNATGADVFGASAGGVEMFQVLNDLKVSLEDSGGKPGEILDSIDAQLSRLLEQRAILGAKSRRLEMSYDRATEVNLGLTDLTSKLEDVDLAEASMYYAMQEAVYQAALMTGAKILQPTLLNFLR